MNEREPVIFFVFVTVTIIIYIDYSTTLGFLTFVLLAIFALPSGLIISSL